MNNFIFSVEQGMQLTFVLRSVFTQKKRYVLQIITLAPHFVQDNSTRNNVNSEVQYKPHGGNKFDIFHESYTIIDQKI